MLEMFHVGVILFEWPPVRHYFQKNVVGVSFFPCLMVDLLEGRYLNVHHDF